MTDTKTIGVADLIQGPTEEYKINQYILTFTDMTRGMVWVNGDKPILEAGDTLTLTQTGNINWKYKNEQQVIPKYKIVKTQSTPKNSNEEPKVDSKTTSPTNDTFYHQLAFDFLKSKNLLTLRNLNMMCSNNTMYNICNKEMKSGDFLTKLEAELTRETKEEINLINELTETVNN